MGAYTKKEIQQIVDEIILDTLAVDQDVVVPTATLKWDLMADSLDAIEIAIKLEKHFGINITDYQINNMVESTVQDLYDMIGELTS
jgi:acyl carrier protein